MKILIIGTDFNAPNSLKTQGQFLRDELVKQHFKVTIASKHRNYVLRILDTFKQILLLKKNDVIIVQVYSTKGIYLEFVSALLGKLKRCKVIGTLHGGNIPTIYQSNFFKRMMLNGIFKFSDIITAPSAFIPEKIPLIKNRHQIIRNIIDLKEYTQTTHTSNHNIRIFWMRAYQTVYDPLKAVQVTEYLLNNNYDVELIMAGSDLGLKKDIVNYIASSGYSDKMKVLDVVSNPEKNEIAAMSTVYLGTNKVDNAPVSFIEMMAMGLPIVSTNIGGIPYYVEDQKTALLSTDNSVENLAQLIINIHKDEQLRKNIITNGYEFIQEFSSETVTQHWMTLLHKLKANS